VQDAVRRRLRMRPLELDDDDLERIEALASAAESEVLAAVEALPTAERDAIRARIVDERDYRELALELSCSESVVRQRVSRGLARIRARVSDESEREERA
jgi:RNA polymerase sigma factor (sigma-70 family)